VEKEKLIAAENAREDIKTGTSRVGTYTVIDKKGKIFPIQTSIAVNKDEKGNPKEFVTVIRDITEAKKAEELLNKAYNELEARVQERTADLVKTTEALKAEITERKKVEKELLFKTALLEAQSDTTIEGILVLDDEGKTLMFNKRFVEMWKVPQEIMDTRNDNKIRHYIMKYLINPEKLEKKVKYYSARKEEKGRGQVQLKDGTVFDEYSSPLIDSAGKYYGRVLYFRDITEQMKTEQALRESESKLKTNKLALERKNVALIEVIEQIEMEKTR